MALITRVARLFKADFHAVLDQIEEPELLLRQAIREMEDELESSERRIQGFACQAEELAGRQQNLAEALAQVDDELDVCFESGEDKLARELIKRKLETERLIKGVESKLASIRTSQAEQEKRLEENRATLEATRQKADLFAEHSDSRNHAANNMGSGTWTPFDTAVSDSDVEVAFLREKKRRAEA